MGLSLRVISIVFLTLAFSLGFTASLIQPKFMKAFAFLGDERHQIQSNGIKDTIETNLNVGLTLDAMQNIQPLLEQTKARDRTILAIAVYDASGKALYSVGHFPAMTAAAGSVGARPSAIVPDGVGVTVPLRNSFDEIVGTLVLRFSRLGEKAVPQAAMMVLLQATALVLAVSALPIITLCLLLLSPIVRQVTELTTTLDGTRPADSGATEQPDIESDHALITAFYARVGSMSEQLESLEGAARS